MAENLVSVLIRGWAVTNAECRMQNADGSALLGLHSAFCTLHSSSNLAALDLFLQLQNPIHQPFWRRRASRHPDVHRDHFVDALHHVVDAIEAAGGGAGAHGDDVL